MWDWNYAFEVLPEILAALKITVTVTFVSFALALAGGLVLALLRRSKSKWLSWPAAAVIEFIRSTPILVQAIILFFVLPLYGITFSAFTAGVIALGLHYSTYLSEVYRSGIDAVQKGQWEAAQALNFSKSQTWIRIILPQAIPPIIPVLGNYLITMFKETPILAAITLMEILATAEEIGSESWRYLEPITIVGILFLLLSYPSSLLVSYLEKRLNRGQT
ncbi:ectoine/hydroxyectoine ABC transporter permease subunit EhuD [Marinicrinis lubricantis]|uniref:Ectoine/hydroxyectoine ABC transporter permease subunit EhuD n=1 Tax=Marinicrinis lubricantis TaxID=2086470 RepID=A0ABW1ILQ0_9BACL